MTPLEGTADALHVATYSGWYRFEQHNGQWTQTDKALTFWKMTALQVDPNDPRHIYVATEHSGLFVTANGGSEWKRAKPNVPRLTTVSLLALPGAILAGTVPAALYRASNGGGWQELAGVREGANGGSFPPSPELGARTRFIADFSLLSKSAACSLAMTTVSNGGLWFPGWPILMCIKFSRAREPKGLSSPLAAKVFIGAWIAASIGKK